MGCFEVSLGAMNDTNLAIGIVQTYTKLSDIPTLSPIVEVPKKGGPAMVIWYMHGGVSVSSRLNSSDVGDVSDANVQGFTQEDVIGGVSGCRVFLTKNGKRCGETTILRLPKATKFLSL